MISRERLQQVLVTLPRLTIGLVGDLFLDRYLDLTPGIEELSIETGIEAWQIERVRNAPGALGTVMNNLAALGVGLLSPATVIGDDGHGYELLREIRRLPVDTSQLMCVRDRLTPTYTKPMRPLADGTRQELNRLDFRTRGPIEMEAVVELCGRVAHVFRSSDGVIVLDQIVDDEQGVVNSAVRQTLAELQRQRPDKLVFVDSRQHLASFNFGILKGNAAEVSRAVHALLGSSAADREHPLPADRAAELLCERSGRTVFCTDGDRGIYVGQPGAGPLLVPGRPARGPVDIVGAGDAATSGIVGGLLAGTTLAEAAALGNLVASITVQKLGTTGTATPAEVLARWDEVYAA